jgi:hypothetical protein
VLSAIGSRTQRATVLLLAGTAAFAVLLIVSMARTTYDFWGAIVLTPVLVAISIPILAAVGREEDERIARLFFIALIVKLGATAIRYLVVYDFYGGVADAAGYDRVGGVVAEQLRNFYLTEDLREIPGTGFMQLLTGIVYALIGPSRFGGFLFFSWLSFWGLVLWYKAFRVAIPHGNRLGYARLVFFLPTLLFWPSSIGKEAWMTLCLGIGALGVARMVTGKGARGAFMLALSLTLITLVRPHMAVLLALAAAVAILARRSSERAQTMGPVLKVAGVAAMAGLLVIFAIQAQQFFEVDELNKEGVTSVLAETRQSSTQGGSTFRAPGGTLSVALLPLSVVTVLFRPFLFEARSGQIVVAAIETLLLLALTCFRYRNIIEAVKRIRDVPFVAFVVSYTLAFCVAFSSIGNFGILARQRTQLLPAFCVLLAWPKPKDPPDDVRPALERSAHVGA